MKKLFVIALTIFCFWQVSNASGADAIEDNSMYIEEAYNQEVRVVQHIFNCSIFSKPENSKAFTFTQEWPMIGQDLQFSYMIPYSIIGGASGIGDAMINFRYQAISNDKLACSPRLSFIAKSGDEAKGLGNGSNGVEVCLPVSLTISDKFVMHFNLGATNLFKTPAKNESALNIFAGVSGVYHIAETCDFLLESIGYFTDVSNTSAKTYIIAPLIRYAINLDKLQIVPMIGAPIKLSSDKPDFGAALYVSFEHPF